MLTAADVEQKTFSTALRGYDLDEVDDFLDEVVGTIRELTEQLEAAQQTRPPAAVPVAAPEPEPETAATPPRPASAIDETAIGRALVAAQTAADQLLADARDQATKIVNEAQGEADTWQAEKEEKRAEAEAEIAALAARVNSIRSELSVLAGEVSEKLDSMEAVISEAGTDSDDWSRGEGADVVAIDDHLMDEPLDLDPDELEDSPDDSGTGEHDDLEAAPETERDHLDEILTGVANDLQFGSSDDDEDESEEDE